MQRAFSLSPDPPSMLESVSEMSSVEPGTPPFIWIISSTKTSFLSSNGAWVDELFLVSSCDPGFILRVSYLG